MIGLMVLLVLCVWMFLANVIARYFLSRMQLEAGKKRNLIYFGLFVLVFIAPVADEIIGGFQFRAMCTPDNLLSYDPEKVKEKTVETNESSTVTLNKIIPIHELTRKWHDADTGEVLIVRKIYNASGGWLSRLIGFPEGSPPYTFDGHCDSKEYYQIFKKLNVTKIEN